MNSIVDSNIYDDGNPWINFEVIARFSRQIQDESYKLNIKQNSCDYVDGIYVENLINGNTRIFNTQEYSINASQQSHILTSKVRKEIFKIIKYFETSKFDFEVSFIEISIFDPLDKDEIKHFYLFCGNSFKYITLYELQCNLDVESDTLKKNLQSDYLESQERGALLTSLGLVVEKSPKKVARHRVSE